MIISDYLKRKGAIVRLSVLVLILIIQASAVTADINVQMAMQSRGSFHTDTIWAGVEHQLVVYIYNNVKMKSMALGVELYSPDGATWQWQAQGDGFGPGGQFTGLQAVTVTPGCRMEPAASVWDAGDLQIVEQDMDGLSPDSFLFSGQAETGGLETGPVDLMMRTHFMPGGVSEGEIKTLCFDSAHIASYGDWLFTDFSDQSYVPYVPGGATDCLPVKLLPCCVPYIVNRPGTPIQMTVDICKSTYSAVSFLDYEGEPLDYQLISCSGDGTVEITLNMGRAILRYTPAQSDVGKIIETAFQACNSSGCSEAYVQSVSVNGHPLTLEIGPADNVAMAENLFVKIDFSIDDPDYCEEHTFEVLSGPGGFDSEGNYIWSPTTADIGHHTVEISATDGYSSDTQSFDIEVISGAGIRGDVNLDGNVNVGDVVTLINYVFRDGPFPQVPNMADPNGDCAINIGDAVYLVGFIFNYGASPLPGCVY